MHLVEVRDEDVVAARRRDEEVLAVLGRSDAIVLGCPTPMGSVSAAFKAFMEAAFDSFVTQAWKEKVAGGSRCRRLRAVAS